MASTEPMMVVHHFSAAVEVLAAELHRGQRHPGAALDCSRCRVVALDALSQAVEPTDAFFNRERACTPRVVPAAWKLTPVRTAPGQPAGHTERWLDRRRGLLVLRSEARAADERWWAHVSASRGDRQLPTWEQMSEIKAVFIGDIEAYMVHPPKRRFVNMHPGVLHWWACLDEPDGVLPDFTMGLGSI